MMTADRHHGFTKGRPLLANVTGFFKEMTSSVFKRTPGNIVHLDFGLTSDRVSHTVAGRGDGAPEPNHKAKPSGGTRGPRGRLAVSAWRSGCRSSLLDIALGGVWCLGAEPRGCSAERRGRAACGGHRGGQGPGPVAQWTTRLTTDQETAGSTPAWLDIFLPTAWP